MVKDRNLLPQLEDGFYLTDDGIETTLIFHEGLELPDFTAFQLLKTTAGKESLRKYYRAHADVAKKLGAGLILQSATWRAHPDWGFRLGCNRNELAQTNRRAIRMLEEIRAEYEDELHSVLISGCVGPRRRGDGQSEPMSARESEAYHREQIELFADLGADLVSALSLDSSQEAIGIARAARGAGVPVVLSFVLREDGNLPTGQTLKSAIEWVDGATSRYPAYYMINSVHSVYLHAEDEWWLERLRGLRQDASCPRRARSTNISTLQGERLMELAIQYARFKAIDVTLERHMWMLRHRRSSAAENTPAYLPLFTPQN